ncbi:uncharacterized protein [Littorina saxatilis]|uniref:uncharacterized protein n=1 Tax=Littorina saxatilis TaxID=31220 RepID=UPI0038B4EE60
MFKVSSFVLITLRPTSKTILQRGSLVWNAVPTLFAVPNPPPKVASGRKPPSQRVATNEASTDLSPDAQIVQPDDIQAILEDIGCKASKSSSSPSPREAELWQKVNKLRSKVFRLEKKTMEPRVKRASKLAKPPKKDFVIEQLSHILSGEASYFAIYACYIFTGYLLLCPILAETGTHVTKELKESQ